MNREQEPGIECEAEPLQKAGPVRTVDPSELHGKHVYVYRNLHNGLFSVWHKGKVLAHVPEIHLDNAQFRVRESGRQKVLREKKKNVHAFVVGTVNSAPTGEMPSTGITYNPYMHPPDQPGSFVRAADKSPIQRADRAHLAIVSTPDGKQRAAMNVNENTSAMIKSEQLKKYAGNIAEHSPSWLGRTTLHQDHHHGLEMDSAVNEFGSKMPREQAEDEAYKKYVDSHREEALHHHHDGMKAAAAAGDTESARKHHMMYTLHAKALGLDPMAPPPARPSGENPSKVYRFKAHKGDAFAVQERAAEEPKTELSKATREHLYVLYLGASTVLRKAEKKKYGKCGVCGKQVDKSTLITLGKQTCPSCFEKKAARPKDPNDLPPTEKSELSAVAKHCKCVAYHFPHRHGGGKCKTQK